MSLINFDGCEPVITPPQPKPRLVAHDLPTTDELIRNNFKRQKTDEEKKKGYRISGEDCDCAPHGCDDEMSEQEKIDNMKEEIKCSEELKALSDVASSTILSRIDQLMDKQFSALFRKQHQLEDRVARIEHLLKFGTKANDPYWDFGNPNELNPYGILHYVANKSMAMIYSAIDKNAGILRDDGTRRKRRPDY